MVVNFDHALAFLLIMLRMTGMLVVHPILGRQNIPVMVNAGLAFVMSIFLVNIVPIPALPTPTLLVFLYWVVKEMLIGIMASMVVRLMLSVMVISGEVVDMQMGMSMAKAFDPGSNTSISLTTQYFNVTFVILFFITNNHLTYLKMATQTFQVVPLGTFTLNTDAFYALPEMLSTVWLFALKLSLPVVVIEIIVTFAVGIIMRIIPQINVFVVNIQFKLFIGLLVLVFLVPSFTGFLENLVTITTENIQQLWVTLLAP